MGILAAIGIGIVLFWAVVAFVLPRLGIVVTP